MIFHYYEIYINYKRNLEKFCNFNNNLKKEFSMNTILIL